MDIKEDKNMEKEISNDPVKSNNDTEDLTSSRKRVAEDSSDSQMEIPLKKRRIRKAAASYIESDHQSDKEKPNDLVKCNNDTGNKMVVTRSRKQIQEDVSGSLDRQSIESDKEKFSDDKTVVVPRRPRTRTQMHADKRNTEAEGKSSDANSNMVVTRSRTQFRQDVTGGWSMLREVPRKSDDPDYNQASVSKSRGAANSRLDSISTSSNRVSQGIANSRIDSISMSSTSKSQGTANSRLDGISMSSVSKSRRTASSRDGTDYTCTHCGLGFKSPQAIAGHMKKHYK